MQSLLCFSSLVFLSFLVLSLADQSNAKDSPSNSNPAESPDSASAHPFQYGYQKPASKIYYYTTPAPQTFEVHCYFANTDYQRPGVGSFIPNKIDPSLCTKLFYAFAVLDPAQLVIRPYDTFADVNQEFYAQVTALKLRGRSPKVILAVGGFQDSCSNKYSRLCKSHTSRTNFTAAVVPFLQTFGFDGLELQWNDRSCWRSTCDHSRLSSKDGFTLLLQELRAAFDEVDGGLLLGMSGSPHGSVASVAYDIPALASVVDWITILTYNFHGFCDGKTGFSEPIFPMEDDETPESNMGAAIQFWLSQGAPKRKIIVGVIGAGKSFALVNSSNHALFDETGSGIFTGIMGEFTNDAGVLAYFELCNLVREEGWTIVNEFQSIAGNYAYKEDKWISWQGPETMRSLAKYIKHQGLLGAGFWNLGYDDFANICNCEGENYPLLRALSAELKGSSPSLQTQGKCV